MRQRARKDGNQDLIVKDLRNMGASVAITSQLGGGYPDLTVGWCGKTYLMEVKDPTQVPSKRKLTPDEEKWHKAWAGHVSVIETTLDALKEMSK